MTETPVRKQGRPRQPFCIDCIRAGRKDVPKKPGQSYCADCLKRRQRDSRTAATQEIDLTDAREKNFRDDMEALRFERDAATDALLELERKYSNMRKLVEMGESPLERELRSELVNVKSRARNLLWEAHEAAPEAISKTDPRWDFT